MQQSSLIFHYLSHFFHNAYFPFKWIASTYTFLRMTSQIFWKMKLCQETRECVHFELIHTRRKKSCQNVLFSEHFRAGPKSILMILIYWTILQLHTASSSAHDLLSNLIGIFDNGSSDIGVGGIHKLRLLDFWPPSPLRWQVYYISKYIVDIWQTPLPLTCQRSLWMPPYQSVIRLDKTFLRDYYLIYELKRLGSKKVFVRT